MDIAKLCQSSHENAKRLGWLDQPRSFEGDIILMHEELSEALADYRSHKGLDETYYEVTFENGQMQKVQTTESIPSLEKSLGKAKSAKPCGIPTELADYVIRIAQHCGSNGVDLRKGLIWSQDTNTPWGSRILGNFEIFLHTAHQLTAGVKNTDDNYRGFGFMLDLVLSYCKENKIDIDFAVEQKAAYNQKREYRHGGRKI